MIKEESREILNQVGIMIANAEAAFEQGNIEGMDVTLCTLRDILDDIYDRTGEEAPKEQEPNKTEESEDKKVEETGKTDTDGDVTETA